MKTNELMEECRKKFSSPKIDKCMDLHIEALEKAYDVGYNDACEKALKWLENNIAEQPNVIKFLKQYLHSSSIEQIDNCVKEK